VLYIRGLVQTGGEPSPATSSAGERLEAAASTNRRLVFATSLTFGSRAFAKAAQILFLIPAAHVLSVDEFASYSYVLVVVAAFTILSDTGAPLVASRDIAAGRFPAAERFWGAAPVVVASAAVGAAALCLFGSVDSGPGTTGLTLALAAAFVVANRAFDFEATTLRALGRFRLEAALQTAGAAAYIVTAVAAMLAGAGVAVIVALLLLKESVSALIAHRALRDDIGPARIRTADWRPLLRAGVVLSLAGIALSIAMRLPLTVLGNSGSAAEIAAFSAAQRFADGAILLATTAGVALIPGVAYLAAADVARVRGLVLRVAAAAAAIGVAVALAAIPLAGPMMALVFGASYRGGGDVLRILLAGLPAYGLLGVCFYALIATHGERTALGLALAGLAIAAVGAAVLIPAGGATGAAWTYVAALATMGLGSAWALVRRLGARHALVAAPAEPA
jgi:O-antigen/teichoic acid export membrane protein